VAFIGAMLSCSATKRTGSDKNVNTIVWQVKPIVADGSNGDWGSPYNYMDGKAKIQYSFSNDKENLYITVMASDGMTQMKMLTAGMQVSIDLQGKKSQNTGISFPLENQQPIKIEENEAKPELTPDRNSAAVKRLGNLIGSAREFSLQGFNDCNGVYLIAQKNKCGIETKIGIDVNNELIWEAIVPFKSFYKASIDRSDLGKAVSICFEINALKKPEMPPSQGPPGGRPAGGMPPMGNMPSGGMPPGGGDPGGGMRGGGPGMDGSGMEEKIKAFEATTTWAKIRLAYNGE
jgi:hypothetical protein